MDIRFVSSIPASDGRPDLPPVEGAMPARDQTTVLASDKVRAGLTAAIKEITSLLDSSATAGSTYALDEVEVSLNMNQNCQVNIILGKLQGNASEGIRLKWKRNDRSQQEH